MIKQNVDQILSELPDGVQLVAAVKARTPEENFEAFSKPKSDVHSQTDGAVEMF